MMIHLEGMGVIGCGVAWALTARGLPFTWHDNNSPVCAWRACTGAIFPSGHHRDVAGYEVWAKWWEGSPWAGSIGLDLLERADYWYCTKQAPHGSGVQPVRTVGNLKLHPQPSFHFNAQEFVARSRAFFSSQRLAHNPTPATWHKQTRLVVSHGFNNRLTRYVWGWTRLVEIKGLEDKQRACVYLRKGRFVMAYAFPTPATDGWYAGSSLIVQTRPSSLDAERHSDRWAEKFNQLGDGHVWVERWLGPAIEGWRPSTGPVAQEDAQPFWLEGTNGTLTVMPCWHSGVRWLPLIVRELMERI